KSGHPVADFVPLSVGELAGHFPQLEIVQLLGRGGMGAVYKARQPMLDRWVALKILRADAGRDPAFAERFTREAVLLRVSVTPTSSPCMTSASRVRCITSSWNRSTASISAA